MFFYFIGTGLLAGILSGLFGIGGGIVIVPMLVFFLKMPQLSANGTSLVALLLPVGGLAVFEYYRLGKITSENIKWGLLISIGLFIGAFLGAKLATQLPEVILRRVFVFFLIGVAIKMWFKT
ncbi:MAG: sulfite exporter TauE/SafE family protein [Bdellovibrionales bacterium]|nr:sulfite exporter TauE/SafE family protein [Bdellovibrionales bacterium]